MPLPLISREKKSYIHTRLCNHAAGEIPRYFVGAPYWKIIQGERIEVEVLGLEV